MKTKTAWLLISLLLVSKTAISGNKPTDDATYCERISSSVELKSVVQDYKTTKTNIQELFKLLIDARALRSKNKEVPNRHPDTTAFTDDFKKLQARLGAAGISGLDDDSGSVARQIHTYITKKVPSTATMNPDIALSQYLQWFFSCAQKVQNSDLKYLFFNPNTTDEEIAGILGRRGDAGLSALQVYMGLPNFRLDDMNRKWVNPVLFILEEGAIKYNSDAANERLKKLNDDILISIEKAKLAKQETAAADKKRKDIEDENTKKEKDEKRAKELKAQPELALEGLPSAAPTFRAIWCKSIDKKSMGSFEVKGVTTGDLCATTDDFINALEKAIAKAHNPYEWIRKPKALSAGGLLRVDNIVTENIAMRQVTILIDPFKEKVYLGNFVALVCASDLSNSLDPENPFRRALEGKYGKGKTISEYDQLKAQYDELNKSFEKAKKSAITVAEAKAARDGAEQIKIVKMMLDNTSKERSPITQLYWLYGIKKHPELGAAISPAKWSEIRDIGGCKLKNKENEDYGFFFNVNGTDAIVDLELEVNRRNSTASKENIEKAPLPEF
jgi:hypothetical protein